MIESWITNPPKKVATDVGNTVTTLESTGLVPKVYDYISYTSGSTTDTYTYKTGGSGGSTVATVTVTWTDSTKTVLSTVIRT